MELEEHAETLSLRSQCRWAAVAVLLVMAVGIAVALPPAIRKRDALRAANEELLSLQASIVATQVQIRDVQAKIVTTQAKIRSILDGNK